MHELSVTQSLLEIALRHAESGGARKITDLYLVQGEFSSFIDEAVQYYWDIIAEDTIAEGARLHFRRIPAQMRCLQCGEHYHPAEAELACPQCGSGEAEIVAGEEFYLDSMDVEEDPAMQGAQA